MPTNADFPQSIDTEPNGNPIAEQSPAMQTGANPTADGLIDRVAQGAHQTIDRLAETAAPHVQRLQEGFNSAGDAIQSRADQALDSGQALAESLRTAVRENPMAALVTALAAGMLIARLTRR